MKRNFMTQPMHDDNFVLLLILALFCALVCFLTGCAASKIAVGANGLDVSDTNPFGETNISYLKMHKTATTLDLEAADYGKSKGTVVQALAIGAGLGALAISGSPALGLGAAGVGGAAGLLPSDKPTSATATAAIAKALSLSQGKP